MKTHTNEYNTIQFTATHRTNIYNTSRHDMIKYNTSNRNRIHHIKAHYEYCRLTYFSRAKCNTLQWTIAYKGKSMRYCLLFHSATCYLREMDSRKHRNEAIHYMAAIARHECWRLAANATCLYVEVTVHINALVGRRQDQETWHVIKAEQMLRDVRCDARSFWQYEGGTVLGVRAGFGDMCVCEGRHASWVSCVCVCVCVCTQG